MHLKLEENLLGVCISCVVYVFVVEYTDYQTLFIYLVSKVVFEWKICIKFLNKRNELQCLL